MSEECDCGCLDLLSIDHILRKFGPLFYGIPTIALYIFLIKRFFRRNSCRNAFFYFFAALGISNSLFFIANFLLDRIVTFSPLCELLVDNFSNPSYTFNFVFIFYFYCPIAQLILVNVIAINRCSTAFFPLYSNQIWMRFIYLILSSLALITFGLTFFNFTNQANVRFVADGQLYFNYIKCFSWQPSSSLVAALTGAFTCIHVMISTIAATIRLYTLSITNRRKAEVNLFVIGVGFSFMSMIYSLYQMCVYYYLRLVKDDEIVAIIQQYRGFVIDLTTLSPAWLFLILNNVLSAKRMERSIDRPARTVRIEPRMTTIPSRGSTQRSSQVSTF